MIPASQRFKAHALGASGDQLDDTASDRFMAHVLGASGDLDHGASQRLSPYVQFW
jgi:hypothetical protein